MTFHCNPTPKSPGETETTSSGTPIAQTDCKVFVVWCKQILFSLFNSSLLTNTTTIPTFSVRCQGQRWRGLHYWWRGHWGEWVPVAGQMKTTSRNWEYSLQMTGDTGDTKARKCDPQHFTAKVRKSFLRVKMLNRCGWMIYSGGKGTLLWGNYHFWVMNDHLWGASVHVDKSFTKIQARVSPPPFIVSAEQPSWTQARCLSKQ